MISPETFYEIKLNSLRTEKRLGTSPWYDQITDQVRNMETGTAIITRAMNFMYYQNMTGPFSTSGTTYNRQERSSPFRRRS
jgi:hypothetical protein